MNMFLGKIFIGFVTLIVVTLSLSFGQNSDTNFCLGAYGGMQSILHTSNFIELPGTQNCCQSFTNGSGLAPYIGFLFQTPLAKQVSLQLRGGFASFTGKFRESEVIGNALDRSSGFPRVVDAVSEYRLDVNFSAAELMPRVSYYPIPSILLALHAGFGMGLFTSKTFQQSEHLIAPSSSVYSSTNKSVRNESTGDIQKASSLMVSVFGGIQYDIRITNRLTLSPEIDYYKPLTRWVDFTTTEPTATWTSNVIRAGIAIWYSLGSETPVFTPAVSPQKHQLIASVVAKELRGSEEKDIAEVRVEETLSRQVYPLLPYVFFDDNVSEINQKYIFIPKSATSSFNEERQFLFDNPLNSDLRSQITMNVYYQILNIIGARMQKFQDAILTITGYVSDLGNEVGSTELARKRAEVVRDYLKERWSLPDSRLTVHSGLLSPTAAKTSMSDARDKQDGIEENRRVEFTSSQPEILYPVVVRDTLRTINTPLLRFRMSATADTAIARWALTAQHATLKGVRAIIDTAASGSTPAYFHVNFNPDISQRMIPKDSTSITYRLEVSDVQGLKAESDGTLRVDYYSIRRKRVERIGNVEVNKYRLVLFDYDSPKLNSMQDSIISRFSPDGETIATDVRDADSIIVAGWTDRKGEEQRNQALSQNRAKSVSEALMKTANASALMNVSGFGERDQPYRNLTPEERLYNRTVEITVIKRAK